MNGWAALAQTATVVLAVDQAVKLLARRADGLRVVEGQLWIGRGGVSTPHMLWQWVIPAVALIIVAAWMPSLSVFVGLMLGGSASNAVEGSLRGSVTDYIRPPFWPAFNIADIALTVGAIGIAVELLRTVLEL
ncbi:signal peptidase II [Mycobacterium sp. ITM-2016-00318]|uniref:signal peptidase II n=1 Tax=Mycobacterium sp. ITM-2016-00318 TaxID=2099693 RepID=UPI001304A4CC|nr:signal peptidase II [Mycobacterium sp. ITM-2016-00318]WNG92619.1 signal peptidase II [Mycobacterium sp. ITM-2016-00318]